MHTIIEHEFLKRQDGQIALLLDVISFDEAVEPVLLVSKNEDKAYLRRSKGDVHAIVQINPGILGDIRKTDNVVVLELVGGKVQHSYAVPTAILEDEIENEKA